MVVTNIRNTNHKFESILYWPCSSFVTSTSKIVSILDNYFQAHVYSTEVHTKGFNFTWIGKSQSGCSAFLANIDEHKAASVTFLGQKYSLPPWSVSILPDCRNVVFNTAQVWIYYWTIYSLLSRTLSTL